MHFIHFRLLRAIGCHFFHPAFCCTFKNLDISLNNPENPILVFKVKEFDELRKRTGLTRLGPPGIRDVSQQ